MVDLSALNAGQREAVTYGEGPLLVLAGAGSGKTKTLINRVAYLIENGEDPRSFFVSTFTKKAATEMKERLAGLVGDVVDNVQIGTFHSFCLGVLRRELGLARDAVLQENRKKWIFKGLLGLPCKEYPKTMDWDVDIAWAMSRISFAKNELLDVHAYSLQVGDDLVGARLAELYKLYEDYKQANNKLDFDDMLIQCWELFKKNPDILVKYQKRFKWVLVDELQDTNLAQWELIKMLAAPHNNITGVGDVDQAIYSFRGARPELVLAFSKMFKGSKAIILEENYRSTPQIVALGNKLIANNSARVRKTLRSMVEKGPAPQYFEWETPEDEAAAVVDLVLVATEWKNPVKGGEIAILYRTNSQSRAFEDELVQRDIPYTIIGSAGFYNRKEIKDIIAYLWAIYTPSDTATWERILNVPNRYFGKQFKSLVNTYAYQNGQSFFEAMQEATGVHSKQRHTAIEFCWAIGQLQAKVESMGPAELIAEVRKTFEYDKHLLKDEGGDDGADNNRIENLNELESAAAKFSNLPAFLDFIAKQQSKTNSDNPDPDKVQLMTVHRSKGLEFPVVFVVGCSDGLLPHKNAYDYDERGELIPESLEEERRLMYVAITRPKRMLYLSSIGEWQNRGMVPSMFLKECGLIEDEVVEAVR